MCESDHEETVRVNMKRQDPCANLLAGGVGGLASLVIGHPFDTVKVRLQTMRTDRKSGSQSYVNARDCFRKIVRHEGVGTLFKGMSALAYSSVPRYGKLKSGFDMDLVLRLPIFSDLR